MVRRRKKRRRSARLGQDIRENFRARLCYPQLLEYDEYGEYDDEYDDDEYDDDVEEEMHDAGEESSSV